MHDVRRPPEDLPVGAGRVRDIEQTVVLAVGSDANIGKMTVMLQLRDAMKKRGIEDLAIRLEVDRFVVLRRTTVRVRRPGPNWEQNAC